MCFTFFFVLSVSETRSIFILKWEGYSQWPVFSRWNILTCQPGFLEAWFCPISRRNFTDPQTCSVQVELRNLWVCFRVISITLTQVPNLLLPKPSQLSGFQLFVICHVNFKWQKWICTTWPSFLFSWRLLFITSKKKLNKLFHASFIHKNCFELFLPAIFYLRYSQLESHVCRLQLTWL